MSCLGFVFAGYSHVGIGYHSPFCLNWVSCIEWELVFKCENGQYDHDESDGLTPFNGKQRFLDDCLILFNGIRVFLRFDGLQ